MNKKNIVIGILVVIAIALSYVDIIPDNNIKAYYQLWNELWQLFRK